MRRILCLLLISFLPFTGIAQHTSHKRTKHHKKSTSHMPLPAWASAHQYDATAHVYFPDYYTFYDPQRGGYLYWDNNNYTFSHDVPPFMKKVDLSKSRVQILKGLSLDMHPELDYPHYMHMYPPDANGNTLVPVPIPGNKGQY